jgi:hypothetical protein
VNQQRISKFGGYFHLDCVPPVSARSNRIFILYNMTRIDAAVLYKKG